MWQSPENRMSFFTAGNEYKIFSFGADYVEIISQNNKQVRVDIDDPDFLIVFNKSNNDRVLLDEIVV